jgi:hypothetical protein
MTAAVVVPLYRAELSRTDTISLTQCCRTLARHPIVLACPERLDVARALSVARAAGVEPRVERIAPDWFESTGTYNALLMSRSFFERFERHEYILVHQLDAFVFADALDAWCARGYDYVGAPWSHEPGGVRIVGNGGFSLRRVDSALKVLRTWRGSRLALRWWKNGGRRARVTGYLYRRGLMARLMRSGPYLPPPVCHALYANEDGFWGQNCDKLPWYSTAPYEAALEFAFETEPEVAYRMNGERLPFGCHAWPLYGAGFWQPHIRRFGYDW